MALALAGAVVPGASARAAGPRVARVCAAAKPGFASCGALRVTAPGPAPSATPSGYGASDIESAYNLPAGAGAGRTVAIVDANDDPTAESDLAAYRTQYGLPPCTTANGCFKKVNQDGATSPLPPADMGWAVEIALDIEMVSAACPACHILLVEANGASDLSFGTGENTAVALGAVAVSNSWGGPDDGSETPDDHYFDHPGVAIAAEAGDNGYGDVEWPAAIPGVIAVGGTSLTKDGGVPRGWTETVWGSTTNSSGGTSSGCSKFETKPAWQSDASCAKRTVADVAAIADPAHGVAVYSAYGLGGWAVVGGTSTATPIVASAFAMANPAAPGAYPAQYLYADPGDLFDITTGLNGTCTTAYFCHGEVGYDAPSGLGTPNGVAAFGPPSPSVTITPAKGPPGTPVTITGSAFVGGDTVKVTYKTGLASPRLLTLCRKKVAANGSFTCSTTIPAANAGAAGRHRVAALDVTTSAAATTVFKLK